ncbi:hypothetical protein WG66_014675 [Moniliophthora roreri]|nr:hypothetical protein WG66_014675 [Moniliophthora roreri]
MRTLSASKAWCHLLAFEILKNEKDGQTDGMPVSNSAKIALERRVKSVGKRTQRSGLMISSHLMPWQALAQLHRNPALILHYGHEQGRVGAEGVTSLAQQCQHSNNTNKPGQSVTLLAQQHQLQPPMKGRALHE